MLKVGQKEIDAVERVIRSGKMFRYDPNGECGRFEKRWGEYVSVNHVTLCSSGTAALAAALGGLGIGPGDEVIVPAHTYMATAIAVLAVGAIPVIVDIDESITLNPEALAEAIGPHTRAVIPVHMWGTLCDMDSISSIARKRNLLVVEDACQCVGGSYKGRAAGSMGDVGAFSFNYFKNMTCGEGGATVTRHEQYFQRIRCMIDPCNFYWEGRQPSFSPFVHCGSRASEFEGAMLNAQLDRLPGLLQDLRTKKAAILKATESNGLNLAPRHSPDGECALNVLYTLPSAELAQQFAASTKGTILANTGRHNYTEWDPILNRKGAQHEALNPFKLKENAACRKEYSKDMCALSLEILGRTVSVGISADDDENDITQLAERINEGAAQALGHPVAVSA